MHNNKTPLAETVFVLFVIIAILIFALSIHALSNVESNVEPSSIPPTNRVTGEWTGKDKDGTTVTIVYDTNLNPYTTKPDLIKEQYHDAFETIMRDKQCSDSDLYTSIFVGMQAVVDNAQLVYGYSYFQIVCGAH